MIRTIKVDINAAYPNMPLEPVNVFAGSAASFTICNVPRSVGDRAITSVSLEFKTLGGTSQTLQAVRVGSAYEVTIPAASLPLPYSAALGVKIVGVGLDENKSAATWVLGAADLNVLNSQGQVTPGADAGDMKHSEFADLDPDTASLADVITRLKGSAMSFVLVLTSLLVSLSSVAALPVTPVYTNHNRVAGNVQTMTNIQAWATAVEDHLDQASGVTPTTVTNIVDYVVASSNLSSIAYTDASSATTLASANAYTDASSATTLASANAYTISATNLLRRVTDMAVYAEGVRPEGPWTWSGEDTNLVYWLNHDAKIPVYNAEGRNTWDLPIYGYHGWYIFGGGQTGDFNAETIEIIAMKEPELEDSTTIYATRPRIVGPTSDRLATKNQLLATSNAIPTNVSQLNNDSGFISDTDPYSGRTIGWNFEDDTFRFNTPITFGSDGSISLTSWRDVYVGFEHLPTMTTNAAESVFAANADYALTNLTGATVALASGQIGNLALDGATSNLTVTLDFSAATDRSGDAMLYLVNAADTFLAIAPAASVTPIGYTASEAMKAGTNIVLMTRMTYSEGKSVVNVAIKEVK